MRIWKPVLGYEGRYEVSNLGEVRSLERVVTRHDGFKQTHGAKMLKQTIGTHGYYAVALCNGGKSGKTRTVHSIVAEAFLGERLDGHETMHINGIRTDNRVENLRYGTNVENQHDRRKHGTHNFGENNPSAKLKSDQVVEIIERLKNGQMLKHIAEDFGVSSTTIRDIEKGRTWRKLRLKSPESREQNSALGLPDRAGSIPQKKRSVMRGLSA